VVQALDLTGLAQKFGSVQCHLKIATDPERLKATRLSVGQCDVLIGADIVTSASDDALARMRKGHTVAVINEHESVTGAFTEDREFRLPVAAQRAAIERFCGDGRAVFVDTTDLAKKLTGNSIGANIMLLGFASQKGWLPVRTTSIEAAITSNGVAVAANLEVFRLGRLLAHDAAQVEFLADKGQVKRASQQISESVEEMIARRVRDLSAYQNDAYGARFNDLVAQISRAENSVAPGSTALTDAVSRNYYKLLAYKDEYEVARLMTDKAFLASLTDGFTGNFKINFHLAPDIISKIDPVTGRPRKRTFGAWMLPVLGLLAKAKRVRGTWLDPFARHADRKAEVALIGEYESTVATILDTLSPENLEFAIMLARWPDAVRGFGPVKAAAMRDAETQRNQLAADYLANRQKLAA
jgi:indolepyruvate ferredoxin oxidoreductase